MKITYIIELFLKMITFMFLGLLGWCNGQPIDGSCFCVDNSGINVRVVESPCGGNLVKEHTVGACFEATGLYTVCDGSDETYYEIKYGPDKLYWMTDDHVNADTTKQNCSGNGGNCSRVQFVTRDEWQARDPVTETPIQPPFSGVFVHHSAWDHCFTLESCIQRVKDIQNLHMDDNGWDDIGYHFLVGEDGRVYEGRGWNNRGAHGRVHNEWTYGICVMGNYNNREPMPIALEAVKDFMDCGVQQGYITQGFEIFGHRDGVCTECPGSYLYEEIQSWPYYSFRTIPVDC